MRQVCLRLIIALAATLGALCASTGASAQETADALHLLLSSFHEAPPIETIQGACDNPVEALSAIARDDAEPLLLRRRAVLALGRLPGDRAEAALLELLMAPPRPELRRAAAIAVSRRFEATDPARAVRLIAPLLESADADDREIAVLLLGRSPRPEARALLQRRRFVERHRDVVDALRRVLSE